MGLDLFRAVAVFGMLVAHVGPAAWTPGPGFGTVHWQWEIFHSRMPAMFAFAAGLSLNLGRRRGEGEVLPAVVPTVIRAGLLAACGLALVALRTPVAVILPSFALWFLLVLPLRRLSTRALLVTAAAWAVAGPAFSFLVRRSGAVPDAVLAAAQVTGDYPALTWMPLVLAGLAVGRMDLSSRGVRTRLAAVGAALVVLGYGVSTAVLAAGGAHEIIATLVPSDGRDGTQEFAHLFFREAGFTETGHWLWLVAPAPHSGSWGDVIGCLGVSALLLAVLLPLGDAIGRPGASPPRRLLALVVSAVAALGAMVLSVYAAHIVAMAAITALTGHSFGTAQSGAVLSAFTLGLMLGAWLWLRRFRRGPLEELLARAGGRIERALPRA